MRHIDDIFAAFVAFIVAACAVFGFLGLLAYLYMLVYNLTIPALIGGPEITFWQMCGLMFLIAAAGNLFRSNVKVEVERKE